MSAQFWTHLKHLQASFDALKRSHDELSERVLALEAEKEPAGAVELDVDTLQPAPKRRGRPPKVRE